jgi:transcriptional regulator with XRE-family HTH domain
MTIIDQSPSNLGRRIREAREAKRMSQVALARIVGISQTTLQKIESGETVWSRFMPQIWAAVGLPLSELNPIFAEGMPAAAPAPAESSYRAEFAELLRLLMAKEANFKATDIAFSRLSRRDNSPAGVLMTVFKPDGSTVQITMDLALARAAARELARLLAGSPDPAR